MLLHRLIGGAYLAIYLYFLSQMVPRLWEYQIELPARSVAHLTFGMMMGAILLVKISVVRFFKQLESKLVPFLGVGLLISTILLMGLSIPFAFREAYLRGAAINGPLSDPQNLGRVREQLLLAGFRDEGDRKRLASPESLRAGQAILLKECVQCHDLRTILARPRTPIGERQSHAWPSARIGLDPSVRVNNTRICPLSVSHLQVVAQLRRRTSAVRTEFSRTTGPLQIWTDCECD